MQSKRFNDPAGYVTLLPMRYTQPANVEEFPEVVASAQSAESDSDDWVARQYRRIG